MAVIPQAHLVNHGQNDRLNAIDSITYQTPTQWKSFATDSVFLKMDDSQ
jgi:hypothetical protein